nr:uncharacterized protein CI109_001329 [Kwoniella shandongensis]KAA5530525.1 hypothetical protein CI109_001329 [Kwoniella shandongensis]
MSRLPPSQFFPDPKGWIETAPSSRPKKTTSTQRPLTSFSHGLSTPPTSTFKRNALAGPGPSTLRNSENKNNGSITKRWKEDNTPIDKTRQGTLRGVFTPPTTGPVLRRGGRVGALKEDKNRKEERENRTPLSQKSRSGSMLAFGKKRDEITQKEERSHPAPGGAGSRLKVYDDDFWRDSSTDEAKSDVDVLPPSSQLKRPTGKPNKSARTPGHHDAAHTDHEKNAEVSNTPSPAQQNRRPSQHRTPFLRKFGTPDRGSSPDPLPPLSSDIKTSPPIPDYVLGNHRQINGQDTARMNRIKSPWRKDRDPPAAAPVSPIEDKGSKKRKRGQITHVEEIDRRVLDKAHENRKKTPDGKPKALVDLSSSDPPEGAEDTKSPTTKRGKTHHGAPLGSMRTNALLPRRSLSKPMIGQISPSPRKRSKKPDLVAISPLPRTSVRNRSLSPENGRSRSRDVSPRPAGPAALEEQLDIAIDKARENAAELDRAKEHAADLEHSLRAIGEAASQASQSQRRTQQPSLSPELITTSPVQVQQPTSPEHMLITPRRRRSSKYHHQVTPPKSRPRPQSMVNRQETLFILPDPPAQPDFLVDRMPSSSPRVPDFQPMEMDPETLITWGPPVQEHMGEDGLDLSPVAELNMASPRSSQSEEAPLFSQPEDSPDRRPSLVQCRSSKSIEPTAFSQDFPVLVRSSPPPESSSPMKSPSRADNVADAPISATSKWDHLNRGILSQHTPTAARSAVATSSQKGTASGKKRKATSSGRSSTGSQTKLAAFGFFGDKGKGKAREAEFGREWDEEEDHDFDEDEPVEKKQDRGDLGQALARVPEPPLHPDLRPAGIREMKRRAAMDSQPHPPSSLTTTAHTTSPATAIVHTPKKQRGLTKGENGEEEDHEAPLFERTSSSSWNGTSSSQTNSSGIQTPGSTRAWLDGLGERRGSEFGTME